MNIRTKKLVYEAVIAALYAALTLALAPISYGGVQFRVSEVLCILPFEVGGFQFTWSPLLLVNFNNEDRGTTVFVQPDLWLKINSHFDIGYRHEYARYKRTDAEGGGSYSRHMPTLQVRWNF